MLWTRRGTEPRTGLQEPPVVRLERPTGSRGWHVVESELPLVMAGAFVSYRCRLHFALAVRRPLPCRFGRRLETSSIRAVNSPVYAL